MKEINFETRLLKFTRSIFRKTKMAYQSFYYKDTLFFRLILHWIRLVEGLNKINYKAGIKYEKARY